MNQYSQGENETKEDWIKRLIDTNAPSNILETAAMMEEDRTVRKQPRKSKIKF